MDSYQRLIQDLPARLPPGRSHRASEKAVRETVAGLPLANPAQATREVERLLDGMLAMTWSGGERIGALEHLRAPVESLCADIERHLGVEAHPLSAAGAERAMTAQRMQEKLMRGYALGLYELCAPAGKLPLFKGRLAATAAARGLVHAERVLAWSYRQYQPVPAGVWLCAHALHAFADELGVAGQAVEDALAEGAPHTVLGAYVQMLLLARSNPNRFSVRELQEARQVIRCIAGACGVVHPELPGVGVDTESDLGPGFLGEERAASGTRILAADVARAQQLFDERIALLPPGVDVIDLPRPGARALTTSVRFINRLRMGWNESPRGRERLSASHVLDVALGMHALHYVLAGNLDFANFVRQLHGDAITVGSNELGSSWMVATDTTHPQWFRCEVQDQSEGGYRLRLHGGEGLRIRIGEVVGLAPVDEEDERDWMVGVIRWLRRDGDAELLGIEMLRREARAAGLRPVTADGETLAPLRAVELLNGQHPERMSLLVTNRLAQNIVGAEVALPARISDWASHTSIATWRMGGTEALGSACFRVILERDAASENQPGEELK